MAEGDTSVVAAGCTLVAVGGEPATLATMARAWGCGVVARGVAARGEAARGVAARGAAARVVEVEATSSPRVRPWCLLADRRAEER